MTRWTAAASLLLVAGVCLGQMAPAAAPAWGISGTVVGGSGRHTIHIALWDAAGFLRKPVREVVIEPGHARDFRFAVPEGWWALSAYEDVNGNGKLDMGTFGPKEPSGFWRPFHGWHQPRFEEVAVKIDRDTTGVEIRLSGH